MACAALIAACAQVPAGFEVFRVIDGDTIVVSLANGQEARIRLLGIDTPEIPRGDSYGERGSLEAAAFLRAWLEGQRVDLVAAQVDA